MLYCIFHLKLKLPNRDVEKRNLFISRKRLELIPFFQRSERPVGELWRILCNDFVSFNHRRSFIASDSGRKCSSFGSNLEDPSLRTPSYILIAGLAFTDFSTGLITQPVYVAAKLVRLKILEGWKELNIVMEAVTNGCAVLFNSTSLLMITLMSIERWLHMTRRSLLTERRAYIMIAVMLLLPIPLAIYRVLFITM